MECYIFQDEIMSKWAVGQGKRV